MYTFRLQYEDQNNVLRQVGHAKTCWVIGPRTRSSVNLTTPSPVRAGGSLDFTIRSRHISPVMPGNFNIKVFLEKFDHYEYNNPIFTAVGTIYETGHDFSSGGEFHYSGTHTPLMPHVEGWYRLRIEVESENGSKEIDRATNFHYRSGFFVKVEPVRGYEKTTGKTMDNAYGNHFAAHGNGFAG
jgi:hypothetical protein